MANKQGTPAKNNVMVVVIRFTLLFSMKAHAEICSSHNKRKGGEKYTYCSKTAKQRAETKVRGRQGMADYINVEKLWPGKEEEEEEERDLRRFQFI